MLAILNVLLLMAIGAALILAVQANNWGLVMVLSVVAFLFGGGVAVILRDEMMAQKKEREKSNG